MFEKKKKEKLTEYHTKASETKNLCRLERKEREEKEKNN